MRGLFDPSAFPHPTRRVQLIQTHISYVFLADEYVYKMKKAVDFGFLDYSTLGKRRYYCHREVKLNAPLCEGTYLGVLPVRKNGRRYTVGEGEGQIVDYVVWMRRLPEDRMLNRLIERGEATPAMVERVAEKLVDFHEETAETSPEIARYGDWAIRYNHQENVDQWTPYVGRTLTAEQHRISVAYGEAFLGRNSELMARRVRDLRIRVTHADLRADAICVENGVCIMDAVEFSRRLSLLDIARDVGFLQMDLEYRGRDDLAKAFIRRYLKLSPDPDLKDVLPFYAYYSACVRGKVESFLIDIPVLPEKEKRAAARRARRYFDLACKYAESLPPAMLVITCGLPGTGKSTIARAIAPHLKAAHIRSDVVRKRLVGMRPSKRVPEAYRAGLYAPGMTDQTYDAMHDEAREKLLAGKSVVLDASYIRRSDRNAAAKLAREVGAQFACVYITADPDEVRRRIETRLKRSRDPSDARWEIYVKQRSRFQRPSEVEEDRIAEVDTSRSWKGGVQAAVRKLRALSPLSVR